MIQYPARMSRYYKNPSRKLSSTYWNSRTSLFGSSLGPRPRRRQLEILCCTRRSDVGLDPSEKPGDFDIVMMPTLEDKYYPQQIMALEVKILRLPAKNRNVHVRPSGAAQAKGLLRDGFPFVGMLHVIIPEPSPREQWKSLEQYVLVNDNLEAQHIGRVPADTIGPDTIRRHFGRMKRYVAETPIGAKAVSLVLDETGRKIIGRDVSNLEIQPEPNSAFDAGLMKRFCDIAAAVKRARG